MTMTPQIFAFINSRLITKSELTEQLLGNRSKTATSRFSFLFKNNKFSPEQLDKLDQIRLKHIAEIS